MFIWFIYWFIDVYMDLYGFIGDIPKEFSWDLCGNTMCRSQASADPRDRAGDLSGPILPGADPVEGQGIFEARA